MRVDPSRLLKRNSSPIKLSIKTKQSRSELANLIFDRCADCQKTLKMSAIPQGAFAARKVRKNMEKQDTLLMKVPEIMYEKPTQDFWVSSAVMEHPPFKYNSKLMNSIWGLYNRYSVHNFKKNTDGLSFVEQQLWIGLRRNYAGHNYILG